ncbi:hypothetical protein B0H14DRAFT_2565379 [Mycena olivaceomarginata]|nr:hypothetical protein B0H14DRAFT_2565379 [Mycena olivaceomarginata]
MPPSGAKIAFGRRLKLHPLQLTFPKALELGHRSTADIESRNWGRGRGAGSEVKEWWQRWQTWCCWKRWAGWRVRRRGCILVPEPGTGKDVFGRRLGENAVYSKLAFRDHVKSTETNPVKAYNAATKRKCQFILRVPGLPADNPQQSEEASHMGSNANHPCRKCNWGGTGKEKETEKLYHECHLAGALRSVGDPDESPKAVAAGNAWKFEGNQGPAAANRNEGQDCAVLDRTEIKAGSRGRSKDEIASEVQNWFSEQPGDKMNPLLNITGLDPSQDTPLELLHTILLGYKNNLIGKHFKTLMQILSFHIHEISTPEQFTLIKAAAELCARLWVPEIDDMEDYLAEMKIAVANLLDAFDVVDPLRILTKIKLHLLAHTMDDIRPSRPNLGWVSPTNVIPGKVEAKPLKKNPAVTWQQSAAFKHWTAENGIAPQLESLWRFGRSLSAQSGDSVAIKNWVVAKDLKGQTIFGRIHEMLTAEKVAFVTLERFMCSQQLHRDFSWPVLRRPNGSGIVKSVQSFLVLPSTSIQFVISVQHDCRIGHCQPAVVGKERQEREDTSRDKSLIKHTDDDHFLINMGALHNFTKLCRVAQRAKLGRDARRKKTAAKRRQNAEAKRQEAEDAERVAEEAEQAARDRRNLEDDADESDPDNGKKEDSDGPESEDEPEREDAEMEDGGKAARTAEGTEAQTG